MVMRKMGQLFHTCICLYVARLIPLALCSIFVVVVFSVGVLNARGLSLLPLLLCQPISPVLPGPPHLPGPVYRAGMLPSGRTAGGARLRMWFMGHAMCPRGRTQDPRGSSFFLP